MLACNKLKQDPGSTSKKVMLQDEWINMKFIPDVHEICFM